MRSSQGLREHFAAAGGACGRVNRLVVGNRTLAGMEEQPDSGAAAEMAFDFHVALVAAHHAVDQRQAETASAGSFGGEEWLDATTPGRWIHARSSVMDLEEDLLWF